MPLRWNFRNDGGLETGRFQSGPYSEFSMTARRITLRVQPPMPFGEVTMVPATLSGRPEADLARAMTKAFAESEAASATDVLDRLRQSFPLTAAFKVVM
jgi:hypothetical protein